MSGGCAQAEAGTAPVHYSSRTLLDKEELSLMLRLTEQFTQWCSELQLSLHLRGKCFLTALVGYQWISLFRCPCVSYPMSPKKPENREKS